MVVNPLTTYQESIEFWVTTGRLVTSVTANITVGGLALFNPANSGKMAIIHDLQVIFQNQTIFPIQKVTSDPALGLVLVPQSLIPGATYQSVLSCSSSPNNVSATVVPAGTLYMEENGQAVTMNEILQNNETIELTPGNGIAIYPFITTIGNYWICSAGWTEKAYI